MTTITETVWDLEPHTAKKHEILRRYFQAWLPILGQFNSRLLYVDAFAGPGEYSKNEDGSPVVVLKAARDHVLKIKADLVCMFIESREDRYEHLLSVLDRVTPTLPNNVSFRALHGEFNDQLNQIFALVEEQTRRRAPTLAFVDPFGFSQTPFSTIGRLMRYPKSEVLVNFMYGHINRFLFNPDMALHFDALFGTPEWHKATQITDPAMRLNFIHDLYLKQLRTVARYVRAFLMVNRSNVPEYFLFFATNNIKGMEAMLQAMWKADPSGDFQFSDFTNAEKQISLFEAQPDYGFLREVLRHDFLNVQIESSDLGDWVIDRVGFLRPHVRTVLTELEKEGLLKVLNPKPARRLYTYPDGTIVKFL